MASAAVLKALFDSDSDEPQLPAAAGGASAPEDERPAAAAPGEAAVQATAGEGDDELDADDERAHTRGGAATGPPLSLELPQLPASAAGVVPVLMKQSNIFQVQTLPFDPANHEIEGYVMTHPVTGQQEVRAYDNNVVRWRYGADGAPESNARLIRWSDGSLQVQLGSETLDVSSVDMARDNTHLCVRVPPPVSVLACQGQVASRLTLRPSSLESKSHKLLAAATAMRHAKVFRVKKTLVTVDPEREKRDAEAAEAQKAKDRNLLRRKQADVARTYALDGGNNRALRGPLTAGFLEEEDDAGAEAAAVPKKRKPPTRRADLYDDEGSDDEGSWSEEDARKASGRKRRVGSDSE